MLRKLIFLSMILTVFGCADLSNSHSEFGSLNIYFQNIDNRTISPEVVTAVDHYEVLGSGPSGNTFSVGSVQTESYFSESLVPGIWSITVNAISADGSVIGTGEELVTVLSGSISSITITVASPEGSGTLNLSLDWSALSVLYPEITAELEDLDGNITPVIFTISGSSATYLADLNSGTYTLFIQLLDGGATVWGRKTAVLIVTNETAYWSVTLE